MQLPIPVGTEGLLLKIRSVEDSLWMSVTIDGQLAASLRVDAYWHSGYVPIGTPISEPAQDAEPEWIESRYFPHFPSTDRIFVIPVWTELWKHNVTWVADFRINQSCYTMMALTLVGMQGIINRSKPRIYLNFTRASNLWIPNLEEHVDIVRLDFDHLSALNFLLERYGSRFTGAVIYDLEVPETINLATMIAGLEDRIILAPVQLQLPGIPDFTSVTEPRQLVQEQGWDTTEESKYRIYQWVYDNLWQNLEHRIIGIISPGPPTSPEIEAESGHYYPLGLAQRDYYVALKLSALWLDPRDSLEAELFNPSTKIKFTLPKMEKVKIEIYSVLGKKVATLLDKPMQAGRHEIEFIAQNLACGVYFYKIKASQFQAVKKMLFLKWKILENQVYCFLLEFMYLQLYLYY